MPALSGSGSTCSTSTRYPRLVGISSAESWLLRAAAFGLPLTYWWLTYDAYVLPKLLAARFVVFALALLFAARALITRSLVVKRTSIDLPLLALIGSAILSAALGVNQNVGIFGTYTRYDGVLTLITYAALFWLTAQAIANGTNARTLIRALLAGGFAVAVVAIAQWLADTWAGQPSARALGTMGNPDILGAYLALLSPAAFGELLDARSNRDRVLAVNALFVMVLALLLSQSRSAWLGLAAGALLMLTTRQVVKSRRTILLSAGALAVAGAAAIALLGRTNRFNESGWYLAMQSLSERTHVWQDSLALIATRPLLGYGPDAFGLVFPRFQSGDWTPYLQIDKAHSDVLQVAATQGAVGVVAYVWLLTSFVVAFWRGRHQAGAWALFAGWVAYVLWLQLNFTALAAALPFWIFAACALATWETAPDAGRLMLRSPLMARIAGAAIAAAAIVLAVPALGTAYLADAYLRDAVNQDVARHAVPAADFAARARELATHESVYAVEAGNIAFERADWAAAVEAYSAASRLGSFDPQMFRNLAVAYRALGRSADALTAAQHAVYLNRFDPANQALLSQMEGLIP